MTLYEMTESTKALYQMLETGEIDEQTLTDTLEAIEAPEKADSYCRVIRQLQADAEALKAEADRLTAKRRAAENAIERMKAALLAFTEASGGRVKTPLFTVTTRITQRVDITDPEAVPAQYRIAQPDKISASEIGKALKAGETVPGATLTSNTSVIIK